ncbi:MAG: hypothetical protein K8W52_01540 [Deltaproteobacteria bacterium]|nr:hypothetical protein [Deltaproteobacteria bacterium]
MSLFALVLGSIRFPAGGLAAWKARPIAPDRYDDWPADPVLFAGAPPAATVGALLAAGAALETDGEPSFLEVEADGDAYAIAGILTGEDAIIAWHLGLVTALREAAAVGGTGAAAIVLPAFGGATRIALADGASELHLGPIADVLADESLARLAIPLDGWMQAKAAQPALRRAPYQAREARFWLDEVATPAEAEALTAARALTDAQLAAALAHPTVCAPRLEPLATHFADPGALRAALDQGTPLARVVAIALAAHADAAAAAPIALALATHPSPYMVRMAARALASAPGDAPLEALLAILRTHPTEWTSALDALARSPHPGTAPRLAAMLASDQVCFDPRALAPADQPARIEGAQRIVRAAAQRKDPALVDALFARFDDPAARWLVPELVRALATQGGAAVEARATELQLAAHGMGKALNQDHARRAAVLGIASAEDSGGIIRYDDLDLAGLTTLLDEGFIHPEARQNDAPPVAAFFQLMTQWPELRATGYAVSPARPDYRTMIDGISVGLEGVPADRADALRAELEALAATATNHEVTDEYVSVWWT